MFLFSRLSASAPEVITTLIIFSLSSGVLGGILFYMDSTAPDVLNDMTSNVPIDMQVSLTEPFYAQTWSNPNSTTLEDIQTSVASQDFVIATEQVTFAQIEDWYEEDYRYIEKGYLGANYSVFDSFSDAIDVNVAELTYDSNSCILERSLFLRIGAEIGDNYTLDLNVEMYNPSNYSWIQIEIQRTFTIVGTFVSRIYMYQPYWGQPETTYLQLISTPEAINETFGILGHNNYFGVQDKIWVKFDHSLIAQTDPASVVESLINVKRRVENLNLPFVLINYDNFQLLDAVNQFAVWSISMRSIALAFSIPSVIMGVMLIQYNSKLLSDSQRRDVGTLKTRGSTGMQAFSWIISNAFATGILGSIGAVGTGILAALLSSTVKELLVFNLEQIAGFSILLEPIAVLSVFLFSFSVGIIVALPAAVRALLMTPSEAHSSLESTTLTDSEKMGSPTIDMVMVGVTGWLLVPMMAVLASSGMSSLGSFSFIVVIIPILGIFLFGFTRILSRPTATIKARILGKVKRPSLVVGTRLMSRTILMFKKSETMGTMFIAMVFTAGLFASISATTGNDHMKQIFMFQTGADIVIDINASFTNVTIDLLENISAVDGVAHVSPMFRTTAYVQYWDAQYFGNRYHTNRSISVYGVDPETWLQSAFWLNYFTHYATPTTSIPKLSERTGDGINIITSFQPIDHYTTDSIGNQYPVYSYSMDLQLITPYSRNITSCTIVDVLAQSVSNYGSVTYFPGEPDANDFVIADLAYIHENLNTTRVSKFYINLELGANYTQVMNEIHTIAPYTFNDIQSPYTSIDEVLDSRGAQSINGAYTLNVIFSLIYLTIGIAIVTIVRVRGLRKQFSVIRALGAPNKSIIVASLAETSIGLLIAAGIGGSIGIALAYLLMNVPLLYMGTATLGLWGRLPVFLQIPFLLVGAIVTLSVIVSLLATYYILLRTLKLNIAEEIQYNE
jgi:ABC-type antimicrobial peptide transport system permease subunit